MQTRNLDNWLRRPGLIAKKETVCIMILSTKNARIAVRPYPPLFDAAAEIHLTSRTCYDHTVKRMGRWTSRQTAHLGTVRRFLGGIYVRPETWATCSEIRNRRHLIIVIKE
jgi:hypothetical protein